MAFWGADTEALRAHADLTDRGAVQIDDIVVRLGILVHSVEWVGNDADAFRQAWDGTTRTLIEAAVDELRRRLREIQVHADEQDGASDDDGGGASVWDRIIDLLDDYEPLESDGFWGDLLGEYGEWGTTVWGGVSIGLDVWGFFDQLPAGDIANIIGDGISINIAMYDMLQAFQDGDIFGVIDAGITIGINGLDMAFTAMGYVPIPLVAGIGRVGGYVTGGLDILWNAATITAAHNPDGIGGGSASRMLIEAPGHAVEALTGWSGLREATELSTGVLDTGGQLASEVIRDHVPIIDPLIDGSQRVVEAPRRLLEEIF